MNNTCKHVGFPIRGRQSTCAQQATDGDYCEVHAPLYKWLSCRKPHDEPLRKLPPIQPLRFH